MTLTKAEVLHRLRSESGNPLGYTYHTGIEWAAKLVEQLPPDDWQDIPTKDGWHWCESLEPDAPPQLLRGRMNLRFNAEACVWESPRADDPLVWSRWTVSGWVPLVGRVAACVRPGGE